MVQLSDKATSTETWLADHADESVRYLLPKGVVVAGGDTPDFLLLRYAGDLSHESGGLLRFTLELEPGEHDRSDPSIDWRPVPLSGGRYRLLIRGLSTEESGLREAWKRAAIGTSTVVRGRERLDEAGAQLLHRHLRDEVGAIDVELAVSFAGLARREPWFVAIDRSPLLTVLERLEDEPFRADEIAATLVSVPDEATEWLKFEGSEARSTSPPQDERSRLLRKSAPQIVPKLFRRVHGKADPGSPFTEPRFVLREDARERAADVRIDLRRPRVERRTQRLSWSIRDFYGALEEEDRRTIFPVVNRVSPFDEVDVHVTNLLSFDAASLREIRVNLQYPNAAGGFESDTIRFAGDTAQLARRKTVVPLNVDVEISYRLTLTFAPATPEEGPVVWNGPGHSTTETVLEIGAGSEVHSVHIDADADLFRVASAVDLLVFRVDGEQPDLAERVTTMRIGPERLERHLVLPAAGEAASYRVQADISIAGEEEAHTVLDEPLEGNMLRLDSGLIRVFEPDPIRVSLKADSQAAFVAIELKAASAPDEAPGQMMTLEAETERTWKLWRAHRFEPVEYRYRLHVIPLDEEGETRPMIVTDWVTADEQELQIKPSTVEEMPTA